VKHTDDVHILSQFPHDYPVAVERRIAMALDRTAFNKAGWHKQPEMPTSDSTWPGVQVEGTKENL